MTIQCYTNYNNDYNDDNHMLDFNNDNGNGYSINMTITNKDNSNDSAAAAGRQQRNIGCIIVVN